VDGAHDMGGMHGFGSVAAIVEEDEPTFHERWEGRTFALMLSSGALRAGGVRPNIEAMPPADYLRASYFERWAFSVERGLALAGTLTTADIDYRVAHPVDVAPTANPGRTAGLVRALTSPRHEPIVEVDARFIVGQQVTVRRMAPAHHHRCPRYVRGVTGTVTAMHGGWPLPQTLGSGVPEALYTVAFAMRDLWGDDAEAGTLFIDLWESYLE
jgi:nitrile hydratase subunit beta